jgi:hypothetical protein
MGLWGRVNGTSIWLVVVAAFGLLWHFNGKRRSQFMGENGRKVVCGMAFKWKEMGWKGRRSREATENGRKWWQFVVQPAGWEVFGWSKLILGAKWVAHHWVVDPNLIKFIVSK